MDPRIVLSLLGRLGRAARPVGRRAGGTALLASRVAREAVHKQLRAQLAAALQRSQTAARQIRTVTENPAAREWLLGRANSALGSGVLGGAMGGAHGTVEALLNEPWRQPGLDWQGMSDLERRWFQFRHAAEAAARGFMSGALTGGLMGPKWLNALAGLPVQNRNMVSAAVRSWLAPRYSALLYPVPAAYRWVQQSPLSPVLGRLLSRPVVSTVLRPQRLQRPLQAWQSLAALARRLHQSGADKVLNRVLWSLPLMSLAYRGLSHADFLQHLYDLSHGAYAAWRWQSAWPDNAAKSFLRDMALGASRVSLGKMLQTSPHDLPSAVLSAMSRLKPTHWNLLWLLQTLSLPDQETALRDLAIRRKWSRSQLAQTEDLVKFWSWLSNRDAP